MAKQRTFFYKTQRIATFYVKKIAVYNKEITGLSDHDLQASPQYLSAPSALTRVIKGSIAWQPFYFLIGP